MDRCRLFPTLPLLLPFAMGHQSMIDHCRSSLSVFLSLSRPLSALLCSAHCLPLFLYSPACSIAPLFLQFSHLAEVSYPPTYQRFLNTLDIFNFGEKTLIVNACCAGISHLPGMWHPVVHS